MQACTCDFLTDHAFIPWEYTKEGCVCPVFMLITSVFHLLSLVLLNGLSQTQLFLIQKDKIHKKRGVFDRSYEEKCGKNVSKASILNVSVAVNSLNGD